MLKFKCVDSNMKVSPLLTRCDGAHTDEQDERENAVKSRVVDG